MGGADRRPELSRQEQWTRDQQRVQGRLIAADVDRQTRDVREAFDSGGSGTPGRTSFEGHGLNTLIDLIEHSDPERLEEAGEALLAARRAIDKAAHELGDFIRAVDWEGDSATAFRDWGKSLVAHALELGDFAEAAGIQITVAGAGLASVRKSLPPRDMRLVPKTVEEVEAPRRIDGNPEYAAAVETEKHRQEAINQANRLASYYAVSEETLAAQAPPRFGKELDIAMPKPQGLRKNKEPGVSSTGSGTTGDTTMQGRSTRAAVVDTGTPGIAGNRADVEALGIAPGRGASPATEIDSVASSQAALAASDMPRRLSPATADPSGSSAVSTPLTATGFVNTAAGGSRRATPSPGLPGAPGRTGKSGRTSSGPLPTGRAGAPVGRPAPVAGGAAGGSRAVPRETAVGPGGTSGGTRPGGWGAPDSKGIVGLPRGAAGSGLGPRGFGTGGTSLVHGCAGRRGSDGGGGNGGTSRPGYLVEDGEVWEAGRRGVVPPVIE
ncbi:hypothetical protein ACFCV8_20710 [Streptomyces sp. NPDC056347]|uniref:hypothetical protein n=1 Tax=Streptomyces sp. NPDC056347 TaxID=3345790 RepID=UPI0035D7E3A8